MLFSSEEDQEERDVDKEKYRSITCPEYVLSNHSMSELRSRTYIKAANVYNNGVSCYLLFVTTEEEIVLYKQYLSFTDDKGYAYRRVIVPLNVVKVFRWNADTFG